jgi:hypothetical protein
VVQVLDGPAAAVIRAPEDAPEGTPLRVRLARGALVARSEGELTAVRAAKIHETHPGEEGTAHE